MTTFKDIQLMNKAKIEYLKKMEQDTKRNDIIEKILKDEVCFFKMDKEDAYMILAGVDISKDKIEKAYNDLISKQAYYDLQVRGKIDLEDSELKIKY